MLHSAILSGLLLFSAATANAQFGPPGGGDGNPFSNGNDGGSGNGNGNTNRPSGPFAEGFASRGNRIIIIHAVCATVAFGFLFPTGSILIRLGSFRGLWLVHGLFQIFAFLAYIVAAIVGIFIVTHARLFNEAHPILGIVLLVLLFFQPFLGFIHHFAFKRHSRRTVWSYAHIWLGRVIITLGIINGGLGLELATRTRIFAPSQGAIIGYAVGAGVMWLLYVFCAMIGEGKRRRGVEAREEMVKAPPSSRSSGGRSKKTSASRQSSAGQSKRTQPA